MLGFTEKPRGDGGWINGGFFVLSPKVLPYIADDATTWEAEPLARLAADEQLKAFEHEGFWHPMDTLRDKNHLEALWQSGRPHGSNGPECGFLARQTRPRHRTHRFQRQLADPVAAKPRRASQRLSLDPSTEPSLFELARVHEGINDQRGDLRDLGALLEIIADTEPEIVLHLAAQPLVREGYRDPLGTYSSNVMGTLNLLEAIRQVGCVRACVLVTTDKVYANKEWLWPYREDEALGGHDPYSSSKACCELLAQSYAASFSRRTSTPSTVWPWPPRALATSWAAAILP